MGAIGLRSGAIASEARKNTAPAVCLSNVNIDLVNYN
jgi:hypothetical protein